MPVPSTTYDIGIPPAPSADIDGFSYIDDEINHSVGWWAAVDTEDGAKGRCYLNSDETELATDSIDFASTGTGQRRIYIGTVLAASSDASRAVRSYPPNTENTSYLATDTYGQYNAYDSNWAGYWPAGGGTERTSNELNLTGFGSIIEGDSSGKIGSATSHNGSTQYSSANIAAITSRPATLLGWFLPDIGPSDMTMVGVANTGSSSDWVILSTDDNNGANEITIWERSGGTGRPYDGNYITSAWNFAYGTLVSETSRFVSLNNQTAIENTTPIPTPSDLNSTAIGRLNDSSPGRYFNGLLQEQQIHDVVRSSSYISQEYSQTNDNATFWGTWTNVPVGETVNLSPLFTGEGSIAAPVTIFELISLSPIFDGTGDLQVSLAIEEILQLIPTFDDDGSILVTITISEDVFLSPVFDGQGEMDISLTIIDNNPVFLSPIFNGEGAFISGLTILGDELSIDTIDTSGKIKRKLKTEGLIVRRFNTSGVLTLELKTTGLLGNNIQTTGDLS